MKMLAMLAAIVLLTTTNHVAADEAGDNLADTVCIAFNFPALPNTYVAGNDYDITQKDVANEGLIYQEHDGGQWLRWTKTQAYDPAQPITGAIYGTCKIYKSYPSETSVPMKSFIVKATKATGPGAGYWFSYLKNP